MKNNNYSFLSKKKAVELADDSVLILFAFVGYAIVFTFWVSISYFAQWWGFMVFQFIVFGTPFIVILAIWLGSLGLSGILDTMRRIISKTTFTNQS